MIALTQAPRKGGGCTPTAYAIVSYYAGMVDLEVRIDGEGSATPEMTPAQARELAHQLLAAADHIEYESGEKLLAYGLPIGARS